MALLVLETNLLPLSHFIIFSHTPTHKPTSIYSTFLFFLLLPSIPIKLSNTLSSLSRTSRTIITTDNPQSRPASSHRWTAQDPGLRLPGHLGAITNQGSTRVPHLEYKPTQLSNYPHPCDSKTLFMDFRSVSLSFSRRPGASVLRRGYVCVYVSRELGVTARTLFINCM